MPMYPPRWQLRGTANLGLPKTSNGFPEGSTGHTIGTLGHTQLVTMLPTSDSRMKLMHVARSGTTNMSTILSWMRTTGPNVYGVPSRADALTLVVWYHWREMASHTVTQRWRAEILNNQFTSVFTTEDPSKPLPDIGPSPRPKVADISIQQNGVLKLLQRLNRHKATGPEEVSAKLLKETAQQVAPALTLLLQASLDQGTIPEKWKAANITPLFKKGDRSVAVNYCPVSLTSVCSKVLEHIVHSRIITHMDPQKHSSYFPLTT